MINRTGIYTLKQDVQCRTSNSRWTVKEGTQFEVTNVLPEKNVFYSYALGGWHDNTVEAILVVPYQCEKLSIRARGDGEGYFLSMNECTPLGDNAYKGKALTRLFQYEQLFSMEPIELHLLLQRMKDELENLRTEKKQFTDARRYGYHPMPRPDEIAELKMKFPAGCRVVVHHVSDPYIYVKPDNLATVHGVDNGGLIHITCDDGTSIKLIAKADQFEKLEEGKLEPVGESVCKRIGDGTLYAKVINDDAYPGIDIEYIPDRENDEALSLPHVLVEWPEGDRLRALVWNDPGSEDFTVEVPLSDEVRKA